jgi:hypothetical protein
MLPLCDVFNGTTAHSANFGQRPFAYTAPAGFKALCSTNLTTPTIQNGSLYFGPSLFSKSAGVSPTVTNAGFQPDFVWIKSRSVSENHYAVDSVRGTSSLLRPNLTDAQLTSQVWLTFNSDGFSPAATGFLTDSATYVGWQWKGGGTGVSNTAGSIASTVSANQTSGFSIVTYTGTGANATVGHGLGVAPSMVIVKKRSSATSSGWAVYHISTGATKYLQLQDVDAANTVSTMWNNTAPTSSVFTIGTDAWVNASSQTNVAYCFAPVSGYSAFGSYTGNASDNGPFIYLGFKAAFILVKRTSTGGEGWWIYDNKRSPYNIANVILSPNLSGAEISGGTYPIDINSNGFKIRGINALLNSNNDTYIYMAFAENPFKIARAR